MPAKKSGGAGASLIKPQTNNGVPVPKILKSANPATHVLLALILESGGLIIVTTIAGLSDDLGNLMIFLMLALLLLFTIMNAGKFAGIMDIATNVEQGAA